MQHDQKSGWNSFKKIVLSLTPMNVGNPLELLVPLTKLRHASHNSKIIFLGSFETVNNGEIAFAPIK